MSRTDIRLGGKWGKLNPLAGEVGGFTSSRRYGIHDYVSYANRICGGKRDCMALIVKHSGIHPIEMRLWARKVIGMRGYKE